MKNKITKKTTTNVKKSRKNPLKLEQDSFFSHDSKRRKKFQSDNGIIESDDSDDNQVDEEDDEKTKYGRDNEEEEDEYANETADERKHRVAKAYLENIKRIAKEQKEDDDDEEEDSDEEEQTGIRKSVTELLQQKQLEESDRVRKLFAARVQKPESHDEFRLIARHGQSVTAIALADDDLTGFSASKDGSIIQWDVESGKSGKYVWPSKEILNSHGAKNPQNPAKKASKHVLSIAVSSDGRYLATGGLDRHVHLWDTRTRQHIQAFPGHRGPVSCVSFRQGASQLISGSYDRTIKLWNVEDRAYMDTLFGHQGEVLTIDCLRKERVLSVGRDRTMRLFKIAEESQLLFRAPAASLECCCFISNDEFLSGSDDGSIELWNPMRKKPAFIVKNAHPVLASHDESSIKDNRIPNGDDTAGNGNIKAQGLCSSVRSWVGSVAVSRSSDLIASGAGNGSVHLWAVDGEAKTIRPLHDLPLVGFVNSLAFAKSGRFLLAGVGQEPRLGRWGRNSAARNGVLIHPLKLSE
ncbi:U3 snoRNP-associated protein-like EMB2271 isoform X1 [Papaver somniferum]|uniref:U3 snoRNP-associated protein-like EMB2271 isoform X1 n=1 Tax=Papaver somniferum TaxID=3469 RepID=UPI000E6F6673|nr:U3 snoRNP-associated protein-like EMB2271 isoform X1 [Papaver somniferum]